MLSRRLPTSRIVAVDLQPMAPIPGVTQLQGDITRLETAERIIACFEGEKADLVVCDGAPDVTGLHDVDGFLQSRLLLSALNISTHLLRHCGTFVAKIFREKDVSLLLSQLRCLFSEVALCKPRASRNASIEAFVVCRDYNPPAGYQPQIGDLYSLDVEAARLLPSPDRTLVPFLACGSLAEYDADMTYEKPERSLEPLQKPIAAPHRKAVEMKRNGTLVEERTAQAVIDGSGPKDDVGSPELSRATAQNKA